MNGRQLLEQIEWLAGEATWADGDAGYIFPRTGTEPEVYITDEVVPEEKFRDMRFPALFVQDAGATPDAQEPDLKLQRVSLVFMVEDTVGNFGREGIIGLKGRDTTGGSSNNRGLKEIVPPVLAQIVGKGRESGLAVIVRPDSQRGTANLAGKTIKGQVVTVQAHIVDTEAGEYPTIRLLASDDAFGTVTLTWTAPPARFDNPSRLAAVVRKSGSEPTSITDGTVLSTSASSGFTDTPGSGTWYYGVASIYDEDTGTRYGALKTVSQEV